MLFKLVFGSIFINDTCVHTYTQAYGFVGGVCVVCMFVSTGSKRERMTDSAKKGSFFVHSVVNA